MCSFGHAGDDTTGDKRVPATNDDVPLSGRKGNPSVRNLVSVMCMAAWYPNYTIPQRSEIVLKSDAGWRRLFYIYRIRMRASPPFFGMQPQGMNVKLENADSREEGQNNCSSSEGSGYLKPVWMPDTKMNASSYQTIVKSIQQGSGSVAIPQPESGH